MANETQNTPETAVKKIKLSLKKSLVYIIGAIIILGALGFGYYKYSHTEKAMKAKAAKEVTALTKEIGAIMVLPEGEPTIFDITDPAQLASQQAFFAGAQKGDKLLVYSQAAKAIIYSPARHLIVNVGPVTFDGNQTPTANAQKQSAQAALTGTTTKR